MSAAVAEATPEAPPARRSKKLLVIVAAAVLLLAAIGGGGFVWWKKKQHAEADEDGGHAKVEQRSGPPTWLPLEPFVVNLADRDADRYAQVGITFEVENAAAADQVRAWMPAVRNSVLLVLAAKTTKDLLDRSGKETLADEILRESGRAMGIVVPAPMPVGTAPAAKAAEPVVDKPAEKPDKDATKDAAKDETPADAGGDKKAEARPHGDDDDDGPPEPKAKKKPEKPSEPAARNPVLRVHFSSFIIQ